ncbi:hypothetical protein CBR_g20455 [Chara braunii]|uniref:Reverse transcriptase domain-containing protein n=1 Tax=Chara braunii TaxID=69332 RepID=A0A388JUE6_CHABU|nr:hypothetical protein CBR_g20455 [Chara braunii]|eukprot:GBG61424.1 hypothetical protein CBR_g20455 [Chara braunii]
MEANLGPLLEFARKASGKKKVVLLSDDKTAQASSGSETEKLRKKGGRLTISEKRKRGPKPVFEDNPPMITPSKRTPRTKAKEGVTVGRVTWSRNKIKTKLSPFIEKLRSPGKADALAKLRFRNQAMEEIRGLDAQELQLICKNEGVCYNGKVKAIFNIASHRTRVAFGEIEGVEQSESGDFEDEESTTSEDVGSKLNLSDVARVKSELEGFVLTPLDRNFTETLALCPAVYHAAMMDTFVLSPGYQIVPHPVGEVLREMREDLHHDGLECFALWDGKRKVAISYVLLKHKDIARYRPICPTFSEPLVRTGRLVSKALKRLSHLLFKLPIDEHFNLHAVSYLASKLQRINNKIDQLNPTGLVRSVVYDIKEMFSRLPHSEIVEAVDWLIRYYREKGEFFVRVNTRGRAATFGLTTGGDHWKALKLDDVLKFVKFDLKHTFTLATGVLLRQTVGILMGKSTRPPLACILCAFYEMRFCRSLRNLRRNVFGLRLIDDVVLLSASLELRTYKAIL